MAIKNIAIYYFFLFVLLHDKVVISGYTVLYNPLSYNPIHCNPPSCKGPVPPEWLSGKNKVRNSADNPAAWWKRGSSVRVKWHRNNHIGGFVRFSLVPLSKIYDSNWHTYTAFHYGCFEGHKYSCKGFTQCGKDNDGSGYYQQVKIPSVFPDGKYVFTMVWYGGVRDDRKNAMFSNFVSSSHVQIKGGNGLGKWYQPKFVPVPSSYDGEQGDRVPKGTCLTTSRWVGECNGRPCYGRKAVATVPGNFKKGVKPETILAKKICEAMG